MIITGGSSGIGRATADLFAKNDWTVYELSRHGESREGVTHITCDVTDPEQCRSAVQQVRAEQGHVDLLISNAGMGIAGAVEFSSTEEIRRQMDVNFFGAVNISQAVLPVMREQRSGRIIFVSSMMAVFAIPFQAFYTASKFAINGYALSLLNEVREFGIKVSCLMPGDVKTGFTGARRTEPKGTAEYPHMTDAIATMERDEQNGQSPERLARKLLRLAEARRPYLLSTVGFQYKLFRILNHLLPASLVYRVVGKMY